jgi:integrase
MARTAKPKDKPQERRKHGEGSHWTDGKRYYYRYKGETVADADPTRAETKLRDLKERLTAGIRISDGRQALTQYADHYLTTILPNETPKESTLADYRKRAEIYILPSLGEYRLDALSADMGRAWRDAMVKHGWARSSTNQALSLAKRILKQAVKDKLIPFNPFEDVKPVAAKADTVIEHDEWDDEEDEDSSAGNPMTLEQVETFMATVAGDWLEPLYSLAFLGFRRGELLGVRYIDYNRDRRAIRVRQQIVLIDGKIEITPPKTQAAKRTVPVLDEHVTMLDAHHRRWLERKMKHRDRWQDHHGLIFCTRYGTPINPRNLLRHYYNTQQKLGWGEWVDKIVTVKGQRVERRVFECWFRFHDLRHTANQLLADASITPKVRAAILGHSRADVTENTYTHASREAKRAALKKVSGTK